MSSFNDEEQQQEVSFSHVHLYVDEIEDITQVYKVIEESQILFVMSSLPALQDENVSRSNYSEDENNEEKKDRGGGGGGENRGSNSSINRVHDITKARFIFNEGSELPPYVSQNRAVTPDDYKTIIQNNYANIDAISVWGGEDNDPPDYGKVYISIKPKDAEVLTATDKTLIISQYLKPKNVVSITPTIIDPQYTYISLDVFFKYNPNVTSLSSDALAASIREVIRLYNTDQLKRFDGVFRYSNVNANIDATSIAILNSVVRVKMKKRIVPTTTAEAKYDVTYSSPIYNTNSTDQIISSTEFVHAGNTGCTLRDRVDNTGTRRLQIVQGTGTTEVIVVNNAGTISPTTGKLSFTAAFDSFTGTYVEITAAPDSNDLAPKRNELLTILVDDCVITGEVDTMITGGTSAGVAYNTTARHE